MRRFVVTTVAALIVTLSLGVYPTLAQTTTGTAASYVPPSFDHPRKVVLSLSQNEPNRVSEVIGNVGNVQRYYGADDVKIALVVYGPGIHSVLKGSPVAERIAGLLAIGVEVLACQNTLTTIHKTAADLLPGVKVVPSGIPAIIEREAQGWYYVRP
ncbi:MAG: DsrE family protein [Vulcanimicrobiaceae bacterium]